MVKISQTIDNSGIKIHLNLFHNYWQHGSRRDKRESGHRAVARFRKTKLRSSQFQFIQDQQGPLWNQQQQQRRSDL